MSNFIQVQAALDGSFQYEIERGRGNVVAALGLALDEATEELVGKLRHDFASSGLRNAERFQGAAWRRELYGKGRSLDPAAWIFSKIPLIVQAFEDAETITTGSKRGLLIPNPQVWPTGRNPRNKRRQGETAWDRAERRFGKLQFIQGKGKISLVIARVRESAKTPGTFRKASAAALRRRAEGKSSGLVDIVVFFVVPQVRVPRLLRGNTIRERARRDFPQRMAVLFLKYFADIDREGQLRLTNQSTPSTRQVSGFNMGPLS